MLQDAAILTALIGATATVVVALLGFLFNMLSKKVEDRRIHHEENRWIVELSSARELELLKARLDTYPEIYKDLAALSSHNIRSIDAQKVLMLADKFNSYGYGKAGLCMLPETRELIFKLRDDCKKFSEGEITDHQLRAGSRSELIEGLRRDLGHGKSYWSDLIPLLVVNRQDIAEVLPNKSGGD